MRRRCVLITRNLGIVRVTNKVLIDASKGDGLIYHSLTVESFLCTTTASMIYFATKYHFFPQFMPIYTYQNNAGTASLEDQFGICLLWKEEDEKETLRGRKEGRKNDYVTASGDSALPSALISSEIMMSCWCRIKC